MPQPKSDDHDFEIHVDPSCLSAPIDDETTAATNMSENEDPNNQATSGFEKTTVDVGGDETMKEDEKEQNPEPDTQTDDTSRPSSSSRRVVSGRTDALIQAAARAVVDQIERQRDTDYNSCSQSGDGDSIVSSAIGVGTELSYTTGGAASDPNPDRRDRDSYASQSQDGSVRVNRSRPRSVISSAASAAAHEEDRGGDSSSHHEAESDVFSERSNPSVRSSLGSFDGRTSLKDAGDDLHDISTRSDAYSSHHRDRHDTMTQRTRTRSPRISDISQYEDHEEEPFVPTIRGRPRVPFRTPSDVRAIQLSSPAPSIFSGSPRSNKRSHLPPAGSRLGSPSASAQYSPKGRTTPSRLKPRKVTPPLVLLHATLLPLRWPWASVLETAPSDALSPAAKALRDNWRRLHDRLGDTVCERGILLPHPQADYEVLEERLLDALDLPLRRRARILECGHYLGPANEHILTEDWDSDDDADGGGDGRSTRQSTSSSSFRHGRHSGAAQTHWCTTCHHDIRYESLGPGKLFHVKVYASNGLMRAGAWSACWKEMERVDVELEPIVEPDLLDELQRLALDQQREAEEGAQALTRTGFDSDMVEADAEGEPAAVAAAGGATAAAAAVESTPSMETTSLQRTTHRHQREPSYGEYLPASSPPLPIEDTSVSPPYSTMSRHDQMEERRRREEARLREIYGESPPPTATRAVTQAAAPPPPESHRIEPEAPPPQDLPPSSSSYMPSSPSEEARARRETRRSDGVPHAHDHAHDHATSTDSTPPPRHPQHAAASSHLQSASLPELLLEAVRVLLQDRKNVALLLMGLLVLFLAIRPPTVEPRMREWDGVFAEPRRAPVAAFVRDEGVDAEIEFERRHAPVEKSVAVSISASTSASASTLVVSHAEQDPPPQSPASSSSTSSVASISASADPRETQESHDEPLVKAEEEAINSQPENKRQEEPQYDPPQQAAQESQAQQQEQQRQVQQQQSSSQQEPDRPPVVHETITTREVVRIIETVTHTETVKAFVTESAEKQVVDIPTAPSDSSSASSSSSSSPVSSESDPIRSPPCEDVPSSPEPESQSGSIPLSEEISEVEVEVEVDEEAPAKEPRMVPEADPILDESSLDGEEKQQEQVVEEQTDIEREL
ncbi:hypothetical protein SODALDRAFT_329355 [Sodiomyces alkalinus F11]|uniref:Pathway-specific nitrogen regulator n=1 Tax=Sodiomyces alkalinus (strain CBS 110278 / VKM F-3762 / F11) TaxID=1314773 RepID=A0A3N2PKX5_SODAK|nr:hypothetical protein SODALDRAFT_329355 [Sodiomyces alkalinus F11]ROT35178.1 hypothetical protein SODALDRAFT_329355 [Sodiomyces alkalinus F11]